MYQNVTCLPDEGGTVYYKCSRCGKTKEKIMTATELLAAGIQLTDASHLWDNWVTEAVATCYEDGERVRWCKRCGDKQYQIVPALDPVYVATKSTRLIDCYTEEDTYEYVCKNCNSEAPDHDAYTKTELKHVVAHYWIVDLEKCVDPWCTTEGYDNYKCFFEDEHAASELGTAADEKDYQKQKAAKKETIPALGHLWSGWTERYDVGTDTGDGATATGYWIRECYRLLAKGIVI